MNKPISTKYCINCKWMRNHLCQSPRRDINVVTGEKEIIECHIARTTVSIHCGLEGSWFEPSPYAKLHGYSGEE